MQGTEAEPAAELVPFGGRRQVRNPKTGLSDASTGRFMNAKKSGGDFKGVRREGGIK